MVQTARVLEKPRDVLIEKGKGFPFHSSKPAQPILYLNSNEIDPPHDWLDDPLEALVRQEMTDYEGKGFEGDLHEHISGAARLSGFGRVLPDQMECLLNDGNTIKPDLSMISWKRQKQRVKSHGPNNRSTLMGSPEFVIEIRSPSNRRAQEEEKRKRYFDNGAEIVWDIDEKEQIIYVYRVASQDIADIYTIDDEIDCEPLLPGWRRQVSALFEEEAPAEVVFSEVHEDGKQIGLEIGKQDMLIRLLQARFVDISEQTLDAIRQTHDIAQLDSWFDQALMSQTLDELVFGDET